MLDEMSIRKHVEWDGKQFRGYVDLGTGINDDSLPEATDTLVFMAVSVNSSWKVPCGYFLVNGLTGAEKANLQILYSFVLRLPQNRRTSGEFPPIIQKYTKFANFASIYFPCFTIFCNRTWHFY